MITAAELEKIEKRVEYLRKIVICQFAGMQIDMDYLLCIPSIHAKYQEEEIVIDFGGGIRQKSDACPHDKAEMLIKWVKLHKDEIMDNHLRVNSSHELLLLIEPLDTDNGQYSKFQFIRKN